MLNTLKDKRDAGFFTSIAGLMAASTVLDLDAFERNTKAEGLGVGPDGPAGEKNMYDADFTTLLFRFLQLTSEGHNNGKKELILWNEPGLVISVYLFVYLFLCLSLCLSVFLTFCIFVCLPAHLRACMPTLLSVCLSACHSICLSECLPACLSICQSARLSVCPFSLILKLGLFLTVCFS